MPSYHKIATGQTVSFFSFDELGDLVAKAKRRGTAKANTQMASLGEATEAERRLEELKAENERLQDILAMENNQEEDTREADALEQENARLARELEQRREALGKSNGDKPMSNLDALRTLDTLAKSATVDHQAVQKQAGDLMEAEVDKTVAERGVPRSQAHSICAKSNAVYKGAYGVLIQSQERALARQTMSDSLGAHM